MFDTIDALLLENAIVIFMLAVFAGAITTWWDRRTGAAYMVVAVMVVTYRALHAHSEVLDDTAAAQAIGFATFVAVLAYLAVVLTRRSHDQRILREEQTEARQAPGSRS